MTFQALQEQYWQLTTVIAELQVEGGFLLNPPFWLSTSRNLQTGKTDYCKWWFDAFGDQQSTPLTQAEYERTQAAIVRGLYLQTLEQQKQQVAATLEHITTLAAEYGLLLPQQEPHDRAVQHSSDSNEWSTLLRLGGASPRVLGRA